MENEVEKLGVGTRVFNCLVDNLCIFIIAYIAYVLLKFAPMTFRTYRFWKVWLAVMGIFYLFFETVFARTPGKWLTLTKVETKQGKRPNLFHVFLRTIIRYTLIDAFFLPVLGKTLHDYASGTEVVTVKDN
jgi:uncharacterized RDD family membrane protein YckC